MRKSFQQDEPGEDDDTDWQSKGSPEDDGDEDPGMDPDEPTPRKYPPGHQLVTSLRDKMMSLHDEVRQASLQIEHPGVSKLLSGVLDGMKVACEACTSTRDELYPDHKDQAGKDDMPKSARWMKNALKYLKVLASRRPSYHKAVAMIRRGE